MSYAKNIQEKKLKAGGTLLFSKFPAHGRLSIVGSIKGGVRLAGNRALAEAHAAMLLEGTDKKSKNDIQILLDDIGASLSFGAEKDRLVFSGHVRASYVKKLFALIAEVLTVPAFPTRELATYKERMTAEFTLEAQETRMQAGINLSHLLYMPGHPNFQASTEEVRSALASLTRSDLKKYHAQSVDRGSLIISVVGDIKPRELQTLVESSFGKLPKNEVSLTTFGAGLPSPAKQSAVHIDDKSSIDYMLGIATGITKDAPDYPALQLGIQVLGNRSGFTGRLMKTVREAEGLTYGVYSYLAGFLNADGFITVWATFAPELYEKGKAALMREIRGIVEGGATNEEVRKHRTMFEARSRVTLSSSGDLARAAHDVAIEGRAMSYLDEFPQRMVKLTAQEVNAALKKYLIPEDLSESAAGPVGTTSTSSK